VSNFDGIVLMKLAHVVLADVEMFRAFVCARCGPVDGGSIVVVDSGAVKGVGHVKILGAKANALEFCEAFVCSNDLSLA
jgi:hypothetical protein